MLFPVTSLLRTTVARVPRTLLATAQPVRMYHEKVLDHYNNPRNVCMPVV